MWPLIVVGVGVAVSAAGGAYHWFYWRKTSAEGTAQQDDASVEAPFQQGAETGGAETDCIPASKAKGPSVGKRSRHHPPIIPEPSKARTSYYSTVIVTKKHNWLLPFNEDDSIQGDRICAEWGIKPEFGWVEDGSFILAVFLDHKLTADADGCCRIPVDKAGSWSAQLAAISKQAVPVLGQETGVWVFHGFFRFREPSGQRAECTRVEKSARHFSMKP